MKLLKKNSIKIRDKEYPLKLCVRAMIEFEQIAGHSISTIESLADITVIFYCTFKYGGSDMSYNEFLDLIDDNPETLNDFADLIMEKTEKKKVAQ
jgi:hypothetical protein